MKLYRVWLNTAPYNPNIRVPWELRIRDPNAYRRVQWLEEQEAFLGYFWETIQSPFTDNRFFLLFALTDVTTGMLMRMSYADHNPPFPDECQYSDGWQDGSFNPIFDSGSAALQPQVPYLVERASTPLVD